MSGEQWELLESIQKKLNEVSDLPPGIMMAIADHLEEAISASSRKPLKALSDQLQELFNLLLRLAPHAAVNAIRNPAIRRTSEYAAFTLGQISFAQLLAAQTSEHRADDNFLATVRDYRYEKYINALYQRDYTGVELSRVGNERVETVSRKLKDLRELGITDFRREGNRIVNFLTPAARSVVNPVNILVSSTMDFVTQPNSDLKSLMARLAPEFQRRPVLSLNKQTPLIEAA